MTLDQAQDKFRSAPGTIAAEQYAKTVRQYHADGMVGDATLTAALREVDAYYVKRDFS